MKKVFGKIKSVFFRAVDGLTKLLNGNKSAFVLIAICSPLLNIIEEWAFRQSLFGAVKLTVTAPVTFIYNTLIILATYSLIYLFRRRLFAFSFVSVFWVTIAFVSQILMGYRTTPFNASDLRVVRAALTIIPIYLDIWEIIAMTAAIVLIITLLVLMVIKCKKSTMKFSSSVIYTIIICLVTLSSTLMNLQFNVDTDHFSNLPTAYRKYGFNFCFLCSIFDHGIDKPKDYSAQVMETIVGDLDEKVKPVDKKTPEKKNMPNIIFLQLESFFDVNTIEGYTYSQQPIPVFSDLKSKYPHGKLRVPSIGAGTANTEFEVITGMEVSYFGVAEYPYLSVLQDNTCESIAYNAHDYGYTSHIIHNYKGTFYDRSKVFPNLGFDTFTSLESMPNIQKNKRGWARDSILTNNILLALKSTPDKSDLVYTISVQPHGRYPQDQAGYEKLMDDTVPQISVTGNEDNPERFGFVYYINELHDVDTFIGTLISELVNNNEPTVLVMYGDHLPAFTVQDWTLTDGDYYQTDYVIWNNCGIDYSDAKDITSYQLSAYIFSKLGIVSGSMNKLNQSYLNSDADYSEERQLLEYDLLYGDKTALSKGRKYAPTSPTFGQAKIRIESVSSVGGVSYIKGCNFNEFSRVTVNNEVQNTSFIDSGTLVLDSVPADGDIIGVIQFAGNHTALGQSQNSVTFKDSMHQEPNMNLPNAASSLADSNSASTESAMKSKKAQ